MTDRERWGLRGPAKSCETLRPGEQSNLSIVYFRPDGSVQQESYKSPPPEWTRHYEYRKDHQLSAVLVEQSGIVTTTTLYKYDAADGDMISGIGDSSCMEYNLGKGGDWIPKPGSARSHRSETRFRYQYDSHSNWIEKITETPDGRVWSVERRTIRYF